MTALLQDVTIGRVTLHEALTARTETARRGQLRLALAGQESSPGVDGLPREAVRRRVEGLEAQIGDVIPVRFDAKPELDGWYRLLDAAADRFEFPDFWRADWRATLELLARYPGQETSLRRAHLTNGHATTSTAGEQWLALPPTADAVDVTELTSAATVVRPSEEGDLTVYRAFTPDACRARWRVDPVSWWGGRARILSDGWELGGEGQLVWPAAWEISNGIVRLFASSSAGRAGTFAVWHGGQWVTLTGWYPRTSAGSITEEAVSAEVLYLTPAEAALRLLFGDSRTTVDLTVRRGSRFIGCRVHSPAATSVGISTTATGYSDQGGVAQLTASDANGHRVCVGAQQAFTTNSDGIVRSATEINGFIGALPDYASLATGDTALALLGQFVEAPVLLDQTVRY